MTESEDTQERDDADTADGPPITARVYDRATGIQRRVREGTTPLVTVADGYLRPVLASKLAGAVIGVFVLAIAVGGLFVFATRSLPEHTTATAITLALVGGSICALAVGALTWGGTRRTSYW
jgi:hypothetical protein